MKTLFEITLEHYERSVELINELRTKNIDQGNHDTASKYAIRIDDFNEFINELKELKKHYKIS